MFRIGEFSKIAQVSGRLLRYYDQIGLLKPVQSDPATGYRFYSAQQLPRLNRILMLKELGLSLDQIAQLLDEQLSVAEMRGMLTLKKAQVEQTLQEEMARLRSLESRLQQIERSGQISDDPVVLKTIAPAPFLALRETFPSLRALRACVEEIHAALAESLRNVPSAPFVVVIHSEIFEPECLDVEMGYLLSVAGETTARRAIPLSGERRLTIRPLEGVETMATVVRLGPLPSRHMSYGTIGTWVEMHGYRLAGLVREVFLQLPSEGKEDEAVIEIQFPVEKVLPTE